MSDCPLCGRILLRSKDKHHLVPKSKGGKETVVLHKICHRFLHATFTEKELAREYNTIEKLLQNDKIKTFVAWVSKKDPDFYDSAKNAKRRK